MASSDTMRILSELVANSSKITNQVLSLQHVLQQNSSSHETESCSSSKTDDNVVNDSDSDIIKSLTPNFVDVEKHYIFLEPPASPQPEIVTEQEPTLIPFEKSEVENTQDKCTICLVDFESSDLVLSLIKCGHWQFHYSCGQKWLNTKGLCPICREKCTAGQLQLCEPMTIQHAKELTEKSKEERNEMIQKFTACVPEEDLVSHDNDTDILNSSNDGENDTSSIVVQDDDSNDEFPNFQPTGQNHSPAISSRRLCNRIREVYDSINRNLCQGVLPNILRVRHTPRRTSYQFSEMFRINLFIKRGRPERELRSIATIIPDLLDEYNLDVDDNFQRRLVAHIERML